MVAYQQNKSIQRQHFPLGSLPPLPNAGTQDGWNQVTGFYVTD